MREIKFRALSKHDLKYIEKGEKGFMFYQQVIEDKDKIPELWFVNEEDPDFRYRFEVVFLDDDWYKMEYIGIKDEKNEREIYEGDIIIPVPNEFNEPPFAVEFLEGCFILSRLDTMTNTFWETNKQFEVIGDKFQNKDLLNLT